MSSPTPTAAWPALSEKRWLRLIAFTLFYLCQGFPIGLTAVAFPAWLLGQGVDKTRVASFVAVVTLPWGLKLIAGPFMDRFAFPAMGLRRPWVLLMQTLLASSGLALVGLHDPHTQLMALTIVCTVMNAFAAMQDVAVDGMAITVLKDDERGTANGFMVAGQVAGYSLTGWLSVVLLNQFGIPAAGILTAVAVGAVGTMGLLFRERPGERLLPWSEGAPHPDAPRPERRTGTLFLKLFRVLVLPMGILLVGVEASYRALEGIAMVWHPDLAITGLGYSDEHYAKWVSICSIVAATVGLGMGPVIDRIGQKRGILIGLASNAVLYALLHFTRSSLTDPTFAVVMLAGTQIGSQWMFISTVSLFMKVCGIRVAATQFSIYMALSNLARSGGAKAYPEFAAWLGADGVFLLMTTGYVISMLIIAGFNLEKHRARLARLCEV